ncbi:MAG: hypothetical protein HYV15_02830, partial [Elusimicrobia bacterium]|nr:hypothetical protein [Elusimicrobiota bacterium]
AAGKVRYTNRPCADAEAVSEMSLRSNAVLPEGTPEPAKAPTPAAAGLKTLTIEAAAFVETRGPDKKWVPLRPVRDSSKAALARAVEAFNAVPGLRLSLDYAEASDSGSSLASAAAANKAGRFIAHWADFPDGEVKKMPYSIGCFPYYRQKDGRIVTWCDPRRAAGESIGGAYLQLKELEDPKAPSYPCGPDSEAVYALRYLGECLGLEFNKDPTSVMGGACRTSYAPPDIEALRKLYGKER